VADGIVGTTAGTGQAGIGVVMGTVADLAGAADMVGTAGAAEAAAGFIWGVVATGGTLVVAAVMEPLSAAVAAAVAVAEPL
jgi:hypothetical protein